MKRLGVGAWPHPARTKGVYLLAAGGLGDRPWPEQATLEDPAPPVMLLVVL